MDFRLISLTNQDELDIRNMFFKDKKTRKDIIKIYPIGPSRLHRILGIPGGCSEKEFIKCKVNNHNRNRLTNSLKVGDKVYILVLDSRKPKPRLVIIKSIFQHHIVFINEGLSYSTSITKNDILSGHVKIKPFRQEDKITSVPAIKIVSRVSIKKVRHNKTIKLI